MEGAAEVTFPIGSSAFHHFLKAKLAIPSGWIVAGIAPAGNKAFSAVSVGLLRIISQPARCATQNILVPRYLS